MNKKLFILTISLIIATANMYAQNISTYNNSDKYNREKNSFQFDKDKVTIGGNFGVGFSGSNNNGNTTSITIAPQIGYFFTPQINAGAGISYTYYRFKIDNVKSTWNYFGINLFGRYYPIQYIVIHAQPEINYLHRSENGDSGSDFVPSFIVGAGVHYGGVTFMLQYDVVQNKYSPYGNNIFYSVGFSF